MAPESEAVSTGEDISRATPKSARNPLTSEDSSDSSGDERSLSDSDEDLPGDGEARSNAAFSESAGQSNSVSTVGLSAGPSRPDVTGNPGAELDGVDETPEFDGVDETPEFDVDERTEAPAHFTNKLSSEKANLAGWLLKRNGGRRPVTLAHCALGSWLQSLFWQRRYFRIDKDELVYRIREGANERGAFGLEHVDQVAVSDSKIWIHFAKEQRTGVRLRKRESLCLAAQSHAEAESWAEALRFAVAGLRTGLPTDWDVREMLRGEAPGASNESVRLVAKKQLGQDVVIAMQKFMDHAFVCKRTQDRKGQALPLRIEVVQVFGVQNISAWTEYAKARAAVSGRIALSEAGSGEIAAVAEASARAEALNRPPLSDPLAPLVPKVRTATVEEKEVWTMLGEVQESANEHWLFHGSTPEAVQSITDSEFRINLAGSHRGTLYGKGVYLAECCSKADEYAEAGEDGLYGMLVCRAALGRILVEKGKKPIVGELEEKCISGEYDSLCGDRWAAANTFREFVVYDGRQVYPAFMVFYKRWSLQHLLASLRVALVADVTEVDEQLLRLSLYTARISENHPNEMVRASIRTTLRSHPELVARMAAAHLSDEAETNRRRLASLLGTLGHASADVITSLSGALQDPAPDVRAAACASLGVFGQGALSAMPVLEELLRDESADVRAASAAALGALAKESGGDAAAEILLNAAADEHACAPVVASLGCLQRQAPRVLPLLSRALASECGETRAAAASALVQLRQAARPLAQELQQALSDESPDVRMAAVEALGEFGSKMNWVAPDLAKRLQDSNESVAVAAAVGLGKCGKLAVVCLPQMSAALHCDSVPVRLALLASFAQLGKIAKNAMPSVCFMLHDPRPEVVNAAQVALQNMGDGARMSDLQKAESGFGGDAKTQSARAGSKDGKKDKKKSKDTPAKEKKERKSSAETKERKDNKNKKEKKEKSKNDERQKTSGELVGKAASEEKVSLGQKDTDESGETMATATLFDVLAGEEALPVQPPSSYSTGIFLAHWSL